MLTTTMANHSLNAIKSKSKSNNDEDEDTQQTTQSTQSEKILTIIIFLFIIYLIVFAWYRAYICSSATPDSRAIHFLFATADPLLYIIFSYAVPGMCGNKK